MILYRRICFSNGIIWDGVFDLLKRLLLFWSPSELYFFYPFLAHRFFRQSQSKLHTYYFSVGLLNNDSMLSSTRDENTREGSQPWKCLYFCPCGKCRPMPHPFSMLHWGPQSILVFGKLNKIKLIYKDKCLIRGKITVRSIFHLYSKLKDQDLEQLSSLLALPLHLNQQEFCWFSVL